MCKLHDITPFFRYPIFGFLIEHVEKKNHMRLMKINMRLIIIWVCLSSELMASMWWILDGTYKWESMVEKIITRWNITIIYECYDA